MLQYTCMHRLYNCILSVPDFGKNYLHYITLLYDVAFVIYMALCANPLALRL